MNLTKKITLNWTAFQSISDLTLIDRNIAGIYVWGFKIDKAFIPYYVGIAYKIVSRMYGHVNSIIGGRYRVFHRDSLIDFKKYKDQYTQVDKSKGEIYLPNWPYGYQNFLIHRKDLQPHIDFMVETISFTYAILDRQEFSNQDFKEIEKICINQIGKENLINERAGRSEKFEIKHIGNAEITDKFITTLR